ncbi:hypothetical protein HNR46_003216 [Haloferula luteola]|uniref:Uncharacterized protein n=1 Tax=Haloferula luteola TaxID=595692 RepID=A0A840V7E8_9BACT|nr:hypothetical protein [Haloferula luteola]MBB5352966.1 hypothetical protein [Haloferula luteola]
MKVLPLLLLLTQWAPADMLPQLDGKPWTGWFAGYESRKFRFGVNREGEAFLMPMKNRDETIYNKQWIRLTPVIEELRSGRGPVTKKTELNGWTALSEKSDQAERISYRGTVTGGAVFEVTLEIDGASVRAKGRLVEKGSLANKELRFGWRVKIPNLYYNQKDEKKLEDGTKGDRYEFVRADGEKVRWDGWDSVNGDEVTGEGFTAARLDLEPYDARVTFETEKGGLFELWNGGEKPLYQGIGVNWIHHPEADPKGEAHFTMTFK